MKFLLIVIVLAIILGGGTLWYKNKSKKEASLTDEKLKEEIGQMIVVGFRGTEASENSDIYKTIRDVKIGGVVLFDYDVPSNSFPRNIINPEQTKKLIADLQKYSATSLFVAVDAEGGNVNRLKQKYGFLPIVSAEKMGQDKTLKTTEKESAKIAEELKDMGFNMNLAPVIDLNINPKNPMIGVYGRSFSPDPEEVASQAGEFIKNHLNNNIVAVGKHFPGQGSATEDSHIGIVDITNTYKQAELFPYQKLNAEGLLNAVMVAHVINKKIDNKYPATLSTAFLQDILRKQIGFKGIIISDDMQMAAISNNYKLDEAVITAVNAGVDIISVLNNSPDGYDKDIAYKVRDIIFNGLKENKIKEERITESYNRILNLKKQLKEKQAEEEKEITKKAAELRARKFELLSVPQNLTFGEILDIAKYVENITGVRAALLLAISQEELALEKLDLCYLTNFDTGEGIRIIDGKKLAKTMKPDRDVQDFLDITRELGRDPLKTLVTCPMSFGWGGAMGPADFIPSTWMRYKDRVEKMTGKSADPWDIQDAFLAMGLYLSDSGAKEKTRDGEWKAAMIYFSESPDSPYTWYANEVLTIAEKFEADITQLRK